MTTRGDIDRLTQIYWMNARIPGLDVSSASAGLRYGIIIALNNPNYARAYANATRRPSADQFEENAVKEFIASVPLAVGGNGA